MEGVCKQKEGEKEVKNVDYFRQGQLPLREGWGFNLADDPTSVVRKFQIDWFRIPVLGEAETAIRLLVKLLSFCLLT